MRRKVTFCCFLISFQAIASSVIWNCFTLSPADTNGYRLSYYRTWGTTYPNYGEFFAETYLTTSTTGSRITLSAHPDQTVLEFSGNWVVAAQGDVVDATTTRNLASYFHHAYIDEPSINSNTARSDYDIIERSNTQFYLMFAVEDIAYRVGSIFGESKEREVFYGWVELEVDSAGNLSLLASAIDLAGGPMIVGGGSAIPEPASGLLLLVGGALLALRRRRDSIGRC